MRAIEPARRHAMIFSRFDALPDGAAIELITDHEPRPLRAEFEATRAGAYAWRQRRVGDGHWEATIGKVAPGGEDEAASALRRSPAFAAAAVPDIATLSARARLVAVRRGRAVVEQGVDWPYVGVVARGSIQGVLVAADGRELVIAELFPGDAFGLPALLDGGVSAMRYVARAEATQVVLVPAPLVSAMMERSPALAGSIAALCAQHLRGILARYAAQAGQPVAARVAETLLHYASPQPGMRDALEPLPSMRQVELAALAGTAKDMVYRSIAEFEEAGALERRSGRIVRLDRARLARIAETVKY